MGVDAPRLIRVSVGLGTTDLAQFSVRGVVKSQLAQSFRVIVLSEVGRGRLTMAFGLIVSKKFRNIV